MWSTFQGLNLFQNYYFPELIEYFENFYM